MHLFYTPNIANDFYTLSEEESRHCYKVLRLNKGDSVNLIDGKGGFYIASIENSQEKKVQLKILSKTENYQKRNHYLHIAIAPTKNIDRLEWFLEKATEIGIDEITPILCERSERKEIKTERLNKVITAAIKQSIKAYHPKLNDIISFKKFINQAVADKKMMAHCLPEKKLSLKDLVKPLGNYLILIGPEGDFTKNEIDYTLNNGYEAITLGISRLRTETAALKACFEINYINEEKI